MLTFEPLAHLVANDWHSRLFEQFSDASCTHPPHNAFIKPTCLLSSTHLRPASNHDVSTETMAPCVWSSHPRDAPVSFAPLVSLASLLIPCLLLFFSVVGTIHLLGDDFLNCPPAPPRCIDPAPSDAVAWHRASPVEEHDLIVAVIIQLPVISPVPHFWVSVPFEPSPISIKHH